VSFHEFYTGGDTVKQILKGIVLIIAIVLAFHASARADCRLDCANEYARGVDVCELIHPDPLDSGDLSMCIGNSQDVYSKCVAGCVYAPWP
jgi:hypothetical protein